MTLDLLLELLRSHLAALRSSGWPHPHGPSNGPALYLDAADTSALITELARIRRKLEIAGFDSAPLIHSEPRTVGSVVTAAEEPHRDQDGRSGACAVRDAHGELAQQFTDTTVSTRATSH